MRTLLIIICWLTYTAAWAQTEVYDTAKRMDPYSSDFQTMNRNFKFGNPTDSAMLFFSQYNKVKRNNTAIQDLGDPGTPYINLQYKPSNTTGLITGFNPYGDYYFYNRNAKFYQAKLPYTYFYYTQGKAGPSGRGLIGFDATHTQNIGERLNFAVNYHSTTNEGFYKRNTNVMKNIQATAYYRSKDQHYLASMIMTWNKTGFNENGGIYQSPLNVEFFKSLPPNQRYVDIELNNARNVNRYRDHQFNQTYWFKGKYSKDTFKKFIPQLGISHSINFQKQSNYYTDKQADFNSHIYDSVAYANAFYSADSMGYSNIGNSIEIFSPIKDNGVSFIAGARYEKINYFQRSNEFYYLREINFNTSVYGQINFNFLKKFQSEVKGNLFLAGYNQTDHYLHWKNNASLSKRDRYKVNFEITSMAAQPTYQQQFMISNHYRWENNFKQQNNQTVSVGLTGKIKRPGIYNAYSYAMPAESFNVQLNYTLLSNYIYYGYDGKPAQMNSAENILQLFIRKHINLKKFQLNQELVYQQFSQELKSKIGLPELLSKTSIYFQSYAFKKATFVQIGMDINYTSEYTGRFYNPETRNFQLIKVKVGNYPYADFFVNAEIKTAKIFFKMEHFNQDLGGVNLFPNYSFVSPYQAAAPRRFRLGVAWKFYY